MTNRAWAIYTLSDPRTEAVRYVGATFRGVRRLVEHMSRAATGGKTHRDCWIRALVLAGHRPTYSVIETGVGEAWKERERYWIATLRTSTNLVNHTDGGEGTVGYKLPMETRKRWSEMKTGVKYAPGRTRPMLGRSHSEEAKAKIAAAGRGRKHTDASKAKLSLAHTGKKLSAEHRQKLLGARGGKPLSAEHREKIRRSCTNRKPVVCMETGAQFDSVTHASTVLGVSEASVNQAIRKGGRCRGMHYLFA